MARQRRPYLKQCRHCHQRYRPWNITATFCSKRCASTWRYAQETPTFRTRRAVLGGLAATRRMRERVKAEVEHLSPLDAYWLGHHRGYSAAYVNVTRGD